MNISSRATAFLSAIITGAAAAALSVGEARSKLDSIPGMGSQPAPIGSNLDGGLVFTNYLNALRDGQFFHLRSGHMQYETPSSPIIGLEGVLWCSNLEFTDIDNANTTANSTIGAVVEYTAHCVLAYLGDFLENIDAAGAQVSHAITSDEFVGAVSLSAVYVPQSNIFEMQWHSTTDNYVARLWDDGRPNMPRLGWEVHDEGDTHPNAATPSWSNVVKVTWVSAEDVALLLNNNADDFTPTAFGEIYNDVWTSSHESMTGNPNTEEELDEAEEVHNTEEELVTAEEVENGGVANDAAEDVTQTEEEEAGAEKDNVDADNGESNGASGNVRRLVVAFSSILSSLIGSV